ncbi:MAG: hypothetical protein AAF518_00140 [Spirochaetota bacterium]
MNTKTTPLQLLSLVFNSPKDFSQAIENADQNKTHPFATLMGLFAAFSITCGNFYPLHKSGGNFIPVLLGFLTSAFFLKFFSTLLALFLHYRINEQIPDADAKLNTFVLYVKYCLAIFLLQTPLSIILFEYTNDSLAKTIISSLITAGLFLGCIAKGIPHIYPKAQLRNYLLFSISTFFWLSCLPLLFFLHLLTFLIASLQGVQI